MKFYDLVISLTFALVIWGIACTPNDSITFVERVLFAAVIVLICVVKAILPYIQEKR